MMIKTCSAIVFFLLITFTACSNDVFRSVGHYSPASSIAVKEVVDIHKGPQIKDVIINGAHPSLVGRNSRIASLVVVFNEAVKLESDTFSLTLHPNVNYDRVAYPDGLGSIPTSIIKNTTDQITWVLTFSGNTIDALDGFKSLRDGVYDFNIKASGVREIGSQENTMDQDSSMTFHCLFGDTDDPLTTVDDSSVVNYTAIINTADNYKFRSTFNNPSLYDASFDYDGSGGIETMDNYQFRSRFNKPLSWH